MITKVTGTLSDIYPIISTTCQRDQYIRVVLKVGGRLGENITDGQKSNHASAMANHLEKRLRELLPGRKRWEGHIGHVENYGPHVHVSWICGYGSSTISESHPFAATLQDILLREHYMLSQVGDSVAYTDWLSPQVVIEVMSAAEAAQYDEVVSTPERISQIYDWFTGSGLSGAIRQFERLLILVAVIGGVFAVTQLIMLAGDVTRSFRRVTAGE